MALLIWVVTMFCLIALPIAAFSAVKKFPLDDLVSSVVGVIAGIMGLVFWFSKLQSVSKHPAILFQELLVIGVCVLLGFVGQVWTEMKDRAEIQELEKENEESASAFNQLMEKEIEEMFTKYTDFIRNYHGSVIHFSDQEAEEIRGHLKKFLFTWVKNIETETDIIKKYPNFPVYVEEQASEFFLNPKFMGLYGSEEFGNNISKNNFMTKKLNDLVTGYQQLGDCYFALFGTHPIGETPLVKVKETPEGYHDLTAEAQAQLLSEICETADTIGVLSVPAICALHYSGILKKLEQQ